MTFRLIFDGCAVDIRWTIYFLKRRERGMEWVDATTRAGWVWLPVQQPTTSQPIQGGYHTYTPGADEKYDATQQAFGYHSWINHTAAAVWEYLDGLQEDFALVVQSNAGAVGFEIAKAHRPTTTRRGHLDSEKMWW